MNVEKEGVYTLLQYLFGGFFLLMLGALLAGVIIELFRKPRLSKKQAQLLIKEASMLKSKKEFNL